MTNLKKKPPFELSNQMELLTDNKPEPGSLDIRTPFRSSITRAINKSGISRHHIAAEMSQLLGYADISKPMLDSYTAESHHEHRLPCEFLPALLIAINNYDPLKIIGHHCRCEVLESKDAIYARLAILEKQKAELENETAKLKSFLK